MSESQGNTIESNRGQITIKIYCFLQLSSKESMVHQIELKVPLPLAF